MSQSISRAWEKVQYQEGSWPKGAVNKAYEVPPELREPDGVIHFAGDQLSPLPGWQEGAVLSAHAVVRTISDSTDESRA